MKKIELLKIMHEGLKRLSECEVMRDDFRHVKMYEEFQTMRENGLKYREAVRMLAEDHKISRATVERIVSRLSGEC